MIIKDLKISIKNDDKLDKRKSNEQVLEIELPNNYVSIPPYKGYTL